VLRDRTDAIAAHVPRGVVDERSYVSGVDVANPDRLSREHRRAMHDARLVLRTLQSACVSQRRATEIQANRAEREPVRPTRVIIRANGGSGSRAVPASAGHVRA